MAPTANGLSPCPICGTPPIVSRYSQDERTGYADEITIRCRNGHLTVTETDDSNPKGGYALSGTGRAKAAHRWETIAVLRTHITALEEAQLAMSRDYMEENARRAAKDAATIEALEQQLRDMRARP